ncbi:hypothetical protein AVEN_121379-1 [Araneus ventricosus]|uniref:Uncharacterized protein n=1 Tax=Araneus ventricosus TaxID=182803 RepID=A0A4Y2CR03_ARAVE|nr:hypothetical protein AVEN_121379-1 [Araneus ventricosus]
MRTLTDRNWWVCKEHSNYIRHRKRQQEIGRRKSVRLQGSVGLHVAMGSPASDGVGGRQWKSTTADRHFAVVGTCARCHSTLHSTEGIRVANFMSNYTSRYVYK